jgi:hypothetical protein
LGNGQPAESGDASASTLDWLVRTVDGQTENADTTSNPRP